jgi:hypothetical protein
MLGLTIASSPRNALKNIPVTPKEFKQLSFSLEQVKIFFKKKEDNN